MDLIKQFGFGYSSNFFDDDSPYLLRIRDEVSDVVELPFRYINTDSPYFQFSKILPGRTITSPPQVLDTWSWELDTLHAEDRLMVLACHPEFIGQPSGAILLDRFIQHALTKPRIWIDRCDRVAEALRPALQAKLGAAA
ncbi:hypothetical protein QWZ10_23510 [Paracoccus cavernae]|uniref:Polysaccharide deacetylase n=2 Tax=Paracoccus cavernae TaxID=1571207 RepID=A0ABT8DBD2_9RHOB|nr:hypothetical protein [Paracoccus cavernae]